MRELEQFRAFIMGKSVRIFSLSSNSEISLANGRVRELYCLGGASCVEIEHLDGINISLFPLNNIEMQWVK